MLELSHAARRRIHNLKYYTWIEQQGRTVEELNAQWHDRDYWDSVVAARPEIDRLIAEFNERV
jgi:cysteine synthase A